MKPERNISSDSIALAIAALSSCAIEGNELAIEILELRKIDFNEFVRRCIKEGFIKIYESEVK